VVILLPIIWYNRRVFLKTTKPSSLLSTPSKKGGRVPGIWTWSCSLGPPVHLSASVGKSIRLGYIIGIFSVSTFPLKSVEGLVSFTSTSIDFNTQAKVDSHESFFYKDYMLRDALMPDQLVSSFCQSFQALRKPRVALQQKLETGQRGCILPSFEFLLYSKTSSSLFWKSFLKDPGAIGSANPAFTNMKAIHRQ